MRWRRLAFLPPSIQDHPSRTLWQAPESVGRFRGRAPLAALFSSHRPNEDRINKALIALRNATLHDLELIEYWDEQPHLQDPEVTGHDEDLNDWNWPYELPRTDVSWRYQLMAELTNRDNSTTPIGFLQIIDPVHEESHYWQSYLDLHPPPNTPQNSTSSSLRAIDIWIGEEKNFRQGYGSQMMKAALEEYCFADDTVQDVLVDPMEANVGAHSFYQRFGFQPEARHSFGDDHCLVHRLTRTQYYKTTRP